LRCGSQVALRFRVTVPRPALEATMSTPTRRHFLRGAAGVTAGAIVGQAAAGAQPAAQALPTVVLGKHRVTRLIIGGNPIYCYAHFNRILSRSMSDWHTPER